jgi:hypothetical protein
MKNASTGFLVAGVMHHSVTLKMQGSDMHTTHLTITIDDDSELGRALDAHPREPITLVRGWHRFRFVPDQDDPWANYDPERLREAIREVAGTLTPEEGDRIKEAIYRAREEGTRPPDGS